MKKLIVICIFIAIFGCAAINENIVKGVNAYCSQPYADRQLTHTLINTALVDTGHRIAVTCSGDQ